MEKGDKLYQDIHSLVSESFPALNQYTIIINQNFLSGHEVISGFLYTGARVQREKMEGLLEEQPIEIETKEIAKSWANLLQMPEIPDDSSEFITSFLAKKFQIENDQVPMHQGKLWDYFLPIRQKKSNNVEVHPVLQDEFNTLSKYFNCTSENSDEYLSMGIILAGEIRGAIHIIYKKGVEIAKDSVSNKGLAKGLEKLVSSY